MNKERILALADLIEAQPHNPSGADSGFNMNAFAHFCGTPSCIAGWAAWENQQRPEVMTRNEIIIRVEATDYLGLDDDRAEDLFYPSASNYEQITPAKAAATLRHLAESGEVEWEAIA